MRLSLSASLLTMAMLLPAGPVLAASINIGNTGGPLVSTSGPTTNPNVSVNLGGAGNDTVAPTASATTNALDGSRSSGPAATVAVGGLGNNGALGGSGPAATVTLGGTGTDGPLGGTAGTATVDLFGSDGASGAAGLGLGDGTGALALGDGNDGLAGTGFGLAGSGSSQAASAGGIGGAGCTGPSAAQLARFLAAHRGADIAGWSRASNIQVVPLKTCAAAKSRLSALLQADGRVQSVQAAAAADPLIRASLNRSHHSPATVIAVDRSGPTLTVYVF